MDIRLLIHSGTIFIATLIISYCARVIYKIIFPKLQKAKHFWHEALLYSLHLPVQIFIYLLGIKFIVKALGNHFHFLRLFHDLALIQNLIILVLIAWFLLRLVNYLQKKFIQEKQDDENGIDQTTLSAICQIFRSIIFVLAILSTLQIFGFPISGLLAFGGMGGLIVGLAAKDMLANFFGGLMIYLDRPFAVGDWIRSPDKNIEGTVEKIGWRLTRVRNFDRRPMFIPNSLFSTITVENGSRMTNRRIKTTINLRYDDATKISDLLKDIETMIKNHDGIDTELPVRVRFVECAAWSLNYLLSAFTKTKNYDEFLEIQQDVFVKMLEIIAEHRAECAFPTTTVEIPKGINTPTIVGA